MTSQAAIDDSEFSFSDKDFAAIAELAKARYGLALQSSKKALVYARLAKRLRVLHLKSFDDYCNLLKAPKGADEQQHFLSALTTNVTHFFREMHHFTMLKEQIAPALLKKAKTGEAVRLWSSACSAGQEAYCMAASLLAGAPDLQKHNVKILATDIDPQIVAVARQARYPADQRAAIPKEWSKLIIGPTNTADQSFEIPKTTRDLVTFAELNLIGDWPMRKAFDVIVCRNAAIYFDKTTQARLWQRFADQMVPGGHLMIGHSERVSGPANDSFRSVGITTYQKATVATATSPEPTKETT
ncbi:MAG: protein-glutamate O-methyltransferase CheR [Pseudomonadota bacterium]